MERIYKYLGSNKTLHFFIIAILSTIAYSNSFYNSFHFDDRYVLLEDPIIKHIDNLPVILSDVFNRPILMATFAISYYFSGLNVLGYHILNLALHIIVSILVYFLAAFISKGFLKQENDLNLFPLVSALIFALHPLHTGSVTYIASRSAVLAAVFYLASLILFLKALSADGRKKYLFHSSAWLLFILSFGVKETVASLPFVTAVYIFVIHRNGLLSYIKKYGIVVSVWFFILGIYILARYLMFAEIVPTDTRIEEGILPRYQYFLTELNVIVFYYMRWLIFPFEGPHADPDIPPETTIFDGSTTLAVLIIAGLITTSLWGRKRWPVVSFGILWYFIVLLPTSSIFPIGDAAVERHVYIPAIGFSLATGYLLARAKDKISLKVLLPVYAALFITLIYFTIASNFIWKSEITLWEDAATKAPNKVRVLNNRAYGYYMAGDVNNAERYYKELLKPHPEYPFGHNNLGLIYQRKGDIANAISEYEKAVAIRPDNPIFRINLGVAYDTAGLFGKAITEFQSVLKLNPINPQAMVALASTLSKTGNFHKSIQIANKTIELEPENAMAYYILGYSYEMSGLFTEALDAYNKALKFNPGWDLPGKRISGLGNRL